MKSKIMTKREELVSLIDNELYNIYSTTVLKNMSFPAIVFVPSMQVPNLDFSSYKNRVLEYQWTLIILDKLSKYENDIECQDEMWALAETLPNLMGIKIIESVPFSHLKDNNELVCIEMKCKSEI